MDPVGAAQGRYRVLRGGSWISDGRDLRSASRGGDSPDGCGRGNGLRLAGG